MRRRSLIVLFLMCVARSALASDCSLTSMSTMGFPGTPTGYSRTAQKLDEGYSAALQITPLNAAGVPDPAGKMGLLLIGNSNARNVHIYSRQIYLQDTTRKLATVQVVVASQSGKTATEWADPLNAAWVNTASLLPSYGVTNLQIQAAHIMLTEQAPLTRGAMHESQLRQIIANLVSFYPNVKMVWFSGLNYTGYSGTTGLAPEPFTRNDSFLFASVVNAPGWPVWVDFLDFWADGININPSTGLSYACNELNTDGVHQTSTLSIKMAQWLHARWMEDPLTAGWFRVGTLGPPPPPTTYPMVVEGTSDNGATWHLIQQVQIPNSYPPSGVRVREP